MEQAISTRSSGDKDSRPSRHRSIKDSGVSFLRLANNEIHLYVVIIVNEIKHSGSCDRFFDPIWVDIEIFLESARPYDDGHLRRPLLCKIHTGGAIHA